MKKIPHPDLPGARRLSPPEMNAIHFGGIHSAVDFTPAPLTKKPETLQKRIPDAIISSLKNPKNS